MGLFDFFTTRRDDSERHGAGSQDSTSTGANAPSPTTGNADDDAQIRFIAERSDLTLPRRWIHYLSFPDAHAAEDAAAAAEESGWPLMRRVGANQTTGWYDVIIWRSDLAVDWISVPEVRTLLTDIAHRFDGSYDMWEASVQEA